MEQGTPTPSAGQIRNESLRTADPLAKKIFEALRVRSINERRHVLRALVAADRRTEIRPAKEQALRFGLDLYQAETGEFPSFTKYEAWRKEQDDRSLVSASKIARAYSTWNLALEAFGLRQRPDPTSLRLLSRGRRFETSELIDALQSCAKDLRTENFTIEQYRDWAVKTLEESVEPRNIPISKSLISRRFGTFRKAKEAAGLDPEETNRSAPNYTDEQLIENLAQARREIEGRLSTAKYSGWRREKQRQANERGTHVDLPCDFTYDQRFGGWLKAVEKVEDLPLRQHGGIGPPVYTPDWIAEKLLEAYNEISDPFYISGYQKWAKAKREQDTDFPPPDYFTISRRIRSWPVTRELVIEAAKSGDPARLVQALREGERG